MNDIVNAISVIGFPVVACIGACFFIKYQFDSFTKQMEDIRKEHKEEITALKNSLDNNTIALTKLLERMEKD